MGRTKSAVIADHVAGGAADARDRVAPAAAALGPQLAAAGAKAREVMESEVLPRLSEGLHAGRVAAEPVAHEAARRGKAAASALAGAAAAAAPQKKKTHKVRTTLLVGLAVGAGVAAWRAWKLPHDSEDWMHADTYNAQQDIPSARSADAPAGAPAAP